MYQMLVSLTHSLTRDDQTTVGREKKKKKTYACLKSRKTIRYDRRSINSICVHLGGVLVSVFFRDFIFIFYTTVCCIYLFLFRLSGVGLYDLINYGRSSARVCVSVRATRRNVRRKNKQEPPKKMGGTR